MRPTSCGTGRWPTCFNPHPTRRPDATSGRLPPTPSSPTSFNPHPTRRPDATLVDWRRSVQKGEVSILTRPEGRMRPRTISTMRVHTTMFQSSPDPKAGCDTTTSKRSEDRTGCFNPHPTRRPDATCDVVMMGKPTRVSILTRPEGRMRHAELQGLPPPRPFQSSPDPKAGCDGPGRGHCDQRHGFNPHPTRRPDATAPAEPELEYGVFQSSPDPKAGCDSVFAMTRSLAAWSFNPHPTRRPDATGTCAWCLRPLRGFNPHPTRRPDATRSAPSPRRPRPVSILTRPEGRMRPGVYRQRQPVTRVSILTRPEGRMRQLTCNCKRL